MSGIKKVFFTLAFILLLCPAVSAEECFTMIFKSGTDVATKAHWTDTTQKFDSKNRKYYSVPFSGIVVTGGIENQFLRFFLPDYRGAGAYTLAGSASNRLADKNNAVLEASGAFWVSPDSSYVSKVIISKDENGLISGNYDVMVYYEGKSVYAGQPKKGIHIRGEFSDIDRQP